MSAPLGLTDLPIEAIERLGCFLGLRDRVALLSCCGEFWRRPELVLSPALWGDLKLGDDEIWPKHRKTSLAAWLARRRHACRRLCLSFIGLGFVGGPTSLLDSLAGGSLADLQLTSTRVHGPDHHGSFEAAFQPLRNLPGITRLELSSFGQDLGGAGLPDSVSALTGLAELDLQRNASRHAPSAGVLTLLQQLTTLTRLNLGECFLRRVPGAVSALKSLKALELCGNEQLGESGEEAWKPLEHLAALTFLDAAGCGLSSIPHAFANLSGLRHLELCRNFPSVVRVEERLFGLTALTFLDLRGCGLLAQDVSSLRSELEVRGACLLRN